MTYIQGFDEWIILMIDKINDISFISILMKIISALGNSGLIWILLGLYFVFVDKKRRKEGLSLLLSISIGALIGNVILKPTICRIRPYDTLGLDIIIKPLHDYSFPSGHTIAAFAAATGVYGFDKYIGKIMYILAVLMGISRLYLMVHYPTDVIVGCIIGIISGFASRYIVNKIIK